MIKARLVAALLVAILLLSASSVSKAQDVCGTLVLSDAQLTAREKLFALRLRTRPARLAVATRYIPIRFHVVRQDDGTGGASISSINQALVVINQLYQPVGVSFYLCGAQPDYIDNTTLFDYDISEESALADANDVLNAVNIYLTNTVTYGGSQVTGYSYYPGSPAITNRVFVKASQVTGSTLAHELGHYFNLYHTFQNSTSSVIANRELVIRPGEPQQGRPLAPNCSDTGDFVCDTPADPYGLSGATVSGCTYTGTITDANGDRFSPLMNNIMSYYSCSSGGNTFTAGQYARIADGVNIRLDAGNDYTLNCADNLAATPAGLTTRLTQSGVLVQFTYTGNDAAGFLIERSTDSTANFSTIGSLPPGSFTFTDGSVASNTTYYYRVKASNTATQYSPVRRINVGLFYCIPTYTWPIAGFFPKIDDFLLTGSQSTLRSLATGAGPAGYSDFSAIEHKVLPGQVCSFTASALSGGSGSYVTQHLTIWLDSNRDGVFSDTEQLFQSSAGQLMSPTIRSTISIPASITVGPVRLRLRSQYAPDGVVKSPCAAYNYGEAEDYTLIIDTPAPPACFSLSASAVAAQCAGSRTGSISLSVVGGTSPFSYSLNNQVQSTGTFTELAAGSYTAVVTDANACNRSLVITVNQPALAIASLTGSTAVCGAQSVSLTTSVTGNRGPYTLQLSDGTSTSTVAGYVSGSPITVFPNRTITYQLQAVSDVGNCSVSVGTASATVTVNPVNQATITPQNTSVCSGQSVTLVASAGSLYRWNTGQATSSLTVTTSGVYSVTITSEFGCTSAASTSVLIADCPRSVLFRGKVLLEGFTNATTGQMHTLLASGNLLPKQQPYSVSPWLYQGTEQVTTFPANVTDWMLLMARTASGTVLARKAVFVRNDGMLIDLDGTEGILFPPLSGPIYISIHHRSHLAIQSTNPIVDNQLVDFTTDAAATRGNGQQLLVGDKLAMHAGDFDANNVINSTDYNRWKINASTVGRYLPADSDGNGVINNRDFNRWMLNRSKIGTPGL